MSEVISCERCGTTEDELSAIIGKEGLYCFDCAEELGEPGKEPVRTPHGVIYISPEPELEPVVIDLAAEGIALGNILGALHELGDASKLRVLEAVKLLVEPPKARLYSPGSAYTPARIANGDGDPVVSAALDRLAAIQGTGDEEAS